MPLLDDMIVRFDADIRPFCNALEQADRKLAVLGKRVNRTIGLAQSAAIAAAPFAFRGQPSSSMVLKADLTLNDARRLFGLGGKAIDLGEKLLPGDPLSAAEVKVLREMIIKGRSAENIEEMLGRSLDRLQELTRERLTGTVPQEFDRAREIEREKAVIERTAEFSIETLRRLRESLEMLGRLQDPSRADIQALRRRIEDFGELLSKLSGVLREFPQAEEINRILRVPEILPPPPNPRRQDPQGTPDLLPLRLKPTPLNNGDPGAPSSLRDEPDGGVIPAVFASGSGDARVNGVAREIEAIDGQAGAWRSVLAQVDEVPPALARTRRETLEVDRAARDLGFTFASAFEDAVVEGESLSDLLRGLEKDILRILTRLLATEPLARGLTAGLGSFTGGGLGAGGGLEGAIGGGLGALANLVPSPVAGLGLGRFNALDALAARDVANPLLAGIFQAGGPVHGPGGPTGDRIPAFLSDGEFVVNAKAARRNRQILEAINANRLSRFMEEGGEIGMVLPEVPPRPSPAPPAREPSIAGRPVVIHIHNPTSVAEIQRGLSQIRGALRETLARAERRGE